MTLVYSGISGCNRLVVQRIPILGGHVRVWYWLEAGCIWMIGSNGHARNVAGDSRGYYWGRLVLCSCVQTVAGVLFMDGLRARCRR